MTFEYETDLEEFTDNLAASVWIKTEYVPGEPIIRYTRNGDGYPGSAATMQPLQTRVTELRGSTWSKSRAELEDFLGRQGMQKLDDMALGIVCELASVPSWLTDELFAALAP